MHGDRGPKLPNIMHELAADSERARVALHLMRVVRKLRQLQPAGLTREQTTNRGICLDSLHEYWIRGRFPKNTYVEDRRVPILADVEGTPCAVAYLMERTGAGELVQELAATNNHVRIPEVTEGRLIEWLEFAGLTQAEAAEIQPSYEPALDFGIFTTAMFVLYAPLRFMTRLARNRRRREGDVLRAAPHMALVSLVLLLSLGIAMAATVIGSPTYDDPTALPYRVSLILAFLLPLLLLEGLAFRASNRLAPRAGLRRAATEASLSLASLAITFVISLYALYPMR